MQNRWYLRQTEFHTRTTLLGSFHNSKERYRAHRRLVSARVKRHLKSTPLTTPTAEEATRVSISLVGSTILGGFRGPDCPHRAVGTMFCIGWLVRQFGVQIMRKARAWTPQPHTTGARPMSTVMTENSPPGSDTTNHSLSPSTTLFRSAMSETI